MISLNIATHKAREQSFKVTLPYVLNQRTKPDRLNIYLNDYKLVPKWLKDIQKEYDHLNVVLGKNDKGDLGASAKFAFLDTQFSGIYITLDDDLIADSGYVGYLADMVNRMGQSFVGLHGTSYKWHPVKSFYHGPGRHIDYCYEGKTQTEAVDMLGTGVLAFPVNIGLTLQDFPEKNMTDPYLFKWAKEHEIPMACLVRAKGFVKELAGSQDSAIWKGVEKDDSKQTGVINSILNFKRQKLNSEFPVSKTGDASLEWGHLKLIANSIRKDEKFVEFGSGVSTQYWKKCGLNFISIEHNEKWVTDKHVQLHAEISSSTGWYKQTKALKNAISQAEVILIDGPIGSTGERYNLPIDLLKGKRMIFVDDVHREKDLKQAKEIYKTLGYSTLNVIKGQKKDLAIIY